MPAVETFKNVPELFEGSFEESIKTRTETMSTFKQLGPDDLVHVVKDIPNSRQQIKEVSSYHFVVGVDTSSSASIAAYINSLTYSLESQQKWLFSHRPNSWNISKCTFCAFNAFSGLDVRVEARIPGGVKSFTVDVMGGKKGADPEIWQETYLSSILRSLRDSTLTDDELTCARRCLDGQFTLQAEMKFLETASKLFYKGRQLGSPHGPHLAGNHDNYLTLGVVEYFCRSGRPEIAIGFLKPFVEKDASLSGLMMKCLLQANSQGPAMQMLTGPNIPHGQVADFLMSRGDHLKAEHFASESLKQSPNSFANWQRLVRIKIALGQCEKALIILNNAPVCAYNDGIFYKQLPKPVLISLPGTETNTATSSSTSASLAILEKLKSSSLKGDYLDAYNLLIEIYRKIGWDALLACRSNVFVMEKEYLGAPAVEVISDSKDVLSEKGKDHDHDIELKSPKLDPVSFVTTPTPNFLHSTGKKLCERWLDNLILILFEDLRIFMHFCAEIGGGGRTGKRGREWLLLGKLSERLHQPEEAKLALQKCLFNSQDQDGSSGNTFDSLKTHQSALNSLIRIYCSEGKSHLALLCSLKLIGCNESVYNTCIHPSQMSLNLCSLIAKLGFDRVYRDLRSIRRDQLGGHEAAACKKVQDFLEAMKDAKIHGYDY